MTAELKASQFESLMVSITNRTKHPQAAFNPRANVRHTLSPLDSAWRDRRTGETMALLARRDGATHVALFGEGLIRVDGSGADARSAYRAAYRQQRLRRHDPADLLRQIATLRRVVDADALLIHSQDAENISLRERLESAENAESAKHRHSRHAAAIRAHRAALRAQRQQYEESLRACRRSLIERTKERGDLALGLAAIRREIVAARQANTHVAFLVPDVTSGGLLDAVRILLKLAASTAEYHRRATAAEARAAELQRGQQALVAAAKAAGFEYAVSALRGVHFAPVAAAQDTLPADAEPRAAQPTGGETPSDHAQDAPNAEQSA
ncbi:MAG: hypothetical protein KatS3mg051_1444 [Anaerolineae bacterium]|nr:MAG: hypothetical protein KatS3mg051_1444 [Anaerolineae bacterium]